MASFYFVHTGKERHQHQSSTDLQAVLITSTHTPPNPTLNLRPSPLFSPGADENLHV